jgi:hypothetical protein
MVSLKFGWYIRYPGVVAYQVKNHPGRTTENLKNAKKPGRHILWLPGSGSENLQWEKTKKLP